LLPDRDNILAPLDNMISRGTDRFLSCKDPDYLASAFQMVQHSLKEEDFGERDVVCAPKLLSIILQCCRGRVDHYVAPFLQVVLVKLQGAKNRTLKVRMASNRGGEESSLYLSLACCLI
jgi:hypothetical protein